MERRYTHTADPRLNCQLPSGELIKRGSTVRIDLAECPEWSAPVKWVRLGWLTEVDEPHESAVLLEEVVLPDADNTPELDNVCESDLEMTDREWLEAHTVRELRAMCADLDISYNGLRKADLVNAILEA